MFFHCDSINQFLTLLCFWRSSLIFICSSLLIFDEIGLFYFFFCFAGFPYSVPTMFPVLESPSPPVLTTKEIIMFHEIDRNVYYRLVIDLVRDPAESMRVMALWLWLETFRCTGLIDNIYKLPIFLTNIFADEAMICLNFLTNYNPLFGDHIELPLTKTLLGHNMSLNFFALNREEAIAGITKCWRETCLRALLDLMQMAIDMKAAQDLAETQLAMSSIEPGFSHLNLHPRFVNPPEAVHPDDRTMFATFSKGYPVPESDILEFFKIVYGDCVESLHMQSVQKGEQALFARIVFYTPDIIPVVLDGDETAKFTIKGRHMWVRKFISKRRIS